MDIVYILYISALLTTQQQVPLLNMKQRVRITIIEAEINANMMRENLYTGSFWIPYNWPYLIPSI